ncbi:MAG: metal ABC transporter permease [Alphaproteobacteria bacterium]|nr:metal ABC transporter permease [Alphaproteobacteria bacterium]
MLDFLTAPFTDYAFMKRALVVSVVLAMGGVPLGVFMMLRRMTLVGDAMSHALLPGLALAFLLCGFSLWAMMAGGLITAIIVAVMAAFLVRYTQLKEEAAFTILYLLSLAAGVALVSVKASQIDLLHLLFGNVLAVTSEGLMLVCGTCVVTLFSLALLYRRLVIDGHDPDFFKTTGHKRWGAGLTGLFFFILLMINLVTAFQAMGTLMVLGLILLPSLAARFWARTLDGMLPLALFFAVSAIYGGLMLSYYAELPPAPAITLLAGFGALLSSIVGTVGSVVSRCR